MASDFQIFDDTREETPRDEEHLDRRRIRAITQERRALHRRVLWLRTLVLLYLCLTVLTAVKAIRSATNPSEMKWHLIVFAVCLALSIRAVYRLRCHKPPPEPIEAPRPDLHAFDALSDGSQYARGLDDLARQREV